MHLFIQTQDLRPQNTKPIHFERIAFRSKTEIFTTCSLPTTRRANAHAYVYVYMCHLEPQASIVILNFALYSKFFSPPQAIVRGWRLVVTFELDLLKFYQITQRPKLEVIISLTNVYHVVVTFHLFPFV